MENTETRVNTVEKVWLSSKEAQAYLGMGEDFFKRLRTDAKLHFYRVGRCVFYAKNDIDELITNNKVV
jgi:hypothetical protein